MSEIVNMRTPWTFDQYTPGRTRSLVDADGALVAKVLYLDDVEHITRCVNVHDDLVEFAKELHRIVADQYHKPEDGELLTRIETVLAKLKEQP